MAYIVEFASSTVFGNILVFFLSGTEMDSENV